MKMNPMMTLALAITTFNTSALSLSDPMAIMTEVDKRQREISRGIFSHSRLTSCPYSAKGKKIVCAEKPRVKEMESVSKQLGANLKDSKNVSILLKPVSENGIGMLTYSYDDSNRDTESWLYLSALGKVKRMATGNSDDQEPVAVFGSEFTTEDMESGKTDEYRYTLLQEGEYRNRDVWVIEAKPNEQRKRKTKYSKMIFWIDKERMAPLKMQSYDKYEKLYKRMLFTNFEKVDNQWLARDLTIYNLQSKRLSNMKTLNYALNADIPDQFLTQRTLTDQAFREQHLSQLRKYIND